MKSCNINSFHTDILNVKLVAAQIVNSISTSLPHHKQILKNKNKAIYRKPQQQQFIEEYKIYLEKT